MALPKLFIIDDNADYVASLSRALQSDYNITTATGKQQALSILRSGCDLILLDIRLNESDKANREGLELLRDVRAQRLDTPVIMMTAYGDIGLAVEAMKEGAADFLQKPFDLHKLRAVLSNALERARLEQRVTTLEQDYARVEPGELVGKNEKITEVRHLVEMVASDGYVTVLIRGETGTGKELVARAIHQVGRRTKEPFVPVAIASLNANLVESELFGHEAGAFTGAKGRRVGLFEKAKRGILFLDEVGDLPAEAQLKLLRFLEERKFSRVGSSDQIEVDIQVLAATNRDLEDAVGSERIRKDLYFRLKSVQIYLPPLRERRDDIPLLLNHFLQLFQQQGRTRISDLSAAAVDSLTKYAWPGNVRELKGVIERAIIYANYKGHQHIEKEDLPLEILNSSDSGAVDSLGLRNGGIDLDRELAKCELSYIEEALQSTQERKTEAWKLLGLNDRFALLRRAKTLLQRNPSLASGFPTVQKLYGRE
jgi:two-component system, NtrC family, response regulator AtoC